MKPSNEMMALKVRAKIAQLESVNIQANADLVRFNAWHCDWSAAMGDISQEIDILLHQYAATLPDQLETESLQLGDHSEDSRGMVEPVSNPNKFEVGGTCDYRGDRLTIIGIWKSQPIMRLELADNPNSITRRAVVPFDTVTNYKPPVRFKAWRYGEKATFSLAEAQHLYAEGIDVIAGHWTPETTI